MHIPKGQGWFALTFVIGFAAPAARAEMITPDSIPNPPSAVGSANGTLVSMNNLVANQYVGLGLSFNYGGTAITSLNGIPVWAPVQASGNVIDLPSPPANYPWGNINYYTRWYGGSLNSLVSGNPVTVSSLTVETLGHPMLSVYGRNGLPLNITPVLQSRPGPNGGQEWTFTGSGIWSFSALMVPPPVVSGMGNSFNPAWGIASVSFTMPAGQTPEPSSLVLAGLGALGVAARFGWRRVLPSIFGQRMSWRR